MASSLLQDLLNAWAVNNRINLLLIEKVPGAGMGATLSSRGGRTVARQLAHVHMVRIAWLETGHALDLVAMTAKFESKAQPTREALTQAFKESGAAIAMYLEDVVSGKRNAASLKHGAGVWFSYLIAHEAHHRGSILLTLKQCGHKLDDTLKWGIWAWDKI